MKYNLVVVDLDDTLFDTYAYFDRHLKAVGIDCNGEYITPQNGGDTLVDLVGTGTFMLEVQPYAGALAFLEKLSSMGIRVIVGTHRGYHEHGAEYSKRSLHQHGLDKYIDSLYCLDNRKYPNKLDFFDELLGRGTYVIFDDRPTVDASVTELPDNVILKTQKWNEHYDHFNRVASFDPYLVRDLLKNLG